MGLLEGKIALVTGSSRAGSIGAAIARRFAAEGAAVAVHGRDQAAARTVAAGLEASGDRALAVTGDLARLAEIEAMRLAIEKQLGPVDVLVANAGGSYTKPAPLEEIPEDGWRGTVDANLTATFLTLKTFLPGMKALGRGSIITISSAAARRPHPQSPLPYAAAKAGIQMLTQHVAAQAGPFGVRVNCVAPETILTEKNRKVIPVETKRTLAEAHPIKRLGTPEDVAEAVLYFASDAAGWVTGTILDVAGGAY